MGAMVRTDGGRDRRWVGQRRACGVLLVVLLAACRPAVEPAADETRNVEHALLTGDVYARRRAVDALVQLGPGALPVLEKALDDRSPDVRAAATQALVRLGSSALPLLGRAVADRKTVVREQATQALILLGAPAVPALQGALASPDHYVRENAASSLGALGPDAIPALQQAIADQDRRVKRAAIAALGQVGPEAIPTLRALDVSGDEGLAHDVERILDRLQSGGGDSKV